MESPSSVSQLSTLSQQEEEEKLVGHRMAAGLTHALQALHHTWDEVGLNQQEQQNEWEGFVHNALEPLLLHWVRSHQRTETLIVQANDLLFQKLVWLVLELQEEPQSQSLASLMSVIQREYLSGQQGEVTALLNAPPIDVLEESEEDEEDELFQLLPFQLGCGALHLPPKQKKTNKNTTGNNEKSDLQQKGSDSQPQRDLRERRKRTYWRRIKRWLPFVRHHSSAESSRWNSERNSSSPCVESEIKGTPRESQNAILSRKRSRDEKNEQEHKSMKDAKLDQALLQLTESATHRDIFSILVKEVRRLCHLLQCRRLVLEILVQQRSILTSRSSPFSVTNKMETYCTALASHQLKVLHHTVSSSSEQLFPTRVLLSPWFSSETHPPVTKVWQGEEIPLPPTNLTSIVAFMNGGNSNNDELSSVQTSMKPSHCFASCRESAIPQLPHGQEEKEVHDQAQGRKDLASTANKIGSAAVNNSASTVEDDDEWGLFMKTSFYRENTDDALNRCSWQPLHLPTPRATLIEKNENDCSTQSDTCLPFPSLSYASLCLPSDVEHLLMDAAKTLPPLTFESFFRSQEPSSSPSSNPLFLSVLDDTVDSCSNPLTFTSLSREIELLTREMTRELPFVITEASQYKALLSLLEKEWVETTALVEEQEVSDPEVVPSPHKKKANLSMTDMASNMMLQMDVLLDRFQMEWKQWEKRDYSFLQSPFPPMNNSTPGSVDTKQFSWWAELYKQRCEIAALANMSNPELGRNENLEIPTDHEGDAVSSNLCCYAALQHVLIGYSCLTPPLRRFASETCGVLSKHMIQKYEAVLQRLALKLAEAYKEYYGCTGDKRYANPPELELKLIGRCDGFSESICKECGPGSLSSTRSPEAIAEYLFAPLRRWIHEAQEEMEAMSTERQALRRRLDILREARFLLRQRQSILEDHRRLLCDKELKGDRLLNKKVNMANQLLQEEQARRRVARELPQLMKKLSRLVTEWKTLITPTGNTEHNSKGLNSGDNDDASTTKTVHNSLTVDGMVVEDILANHHADLMAHGISAADRGVRSRAGAHSTTPPASRTPTPPIRAKTPTQDRSISHSRTPGGTTPSHHHPHCFSSSPIARRVVRNALSPPPPATPVRLPATSAMRKKDAVPLLRRRMETNEAADLSSSAVVKPFRKRTRESPPPPSHNRKTNNNEA